MPDLHPVAAMPGWWWLVVAALAIIGAGCLGVALWRLTRRPSAPAADDSLETLRAATLQAIGDASQHEPAQAACREIVTATRRFVGIVTNTSVDYFGTTQLNWAARRNPRLEPVARLVRDTQEWCFNPDSQPDVAAVATQAEQVVSSWR